MGSRGASSGSRKSSIGGANSESNATPKSAKIGDEVYIAKWFKLELPSYAMQPHSVKITGESASGKAWKIDVDTETKDGEKDLYFSKYVPKAAVLTKSQRAEASKASQNRYESGKQKYSAMIKFAKDNGVKGVRTGMRKETILEKIKKAGLKYSY